MKAFKIDKLNHPSKITLSTDVPRPVPRAGEVLVEVYAAGLNFFDILQAQGKYQHKPPIPFVLGAEFSGCIASDSPIPSGCIFRPGDKVFGQAQGSFGEYVAVSVQLIIPIPPGLSFAEAATLPVTFTTSYQGLVDIGKAKPGEWVLVHGGAGGVSLAACQIAKFLGCKVIATASSERKRQICIEKGGADAVVDYSKPEWQKEVMRITKKGANVVYDPVGMLIPTLKCVAWDARLVVVGFAAGTIEKVPANLILLKQVSITGLNWGGTVKNNYRRAQEIVKELMKLMSKGQLRPVVYEPIYDGLELVAQGLQDLEDRKTWGKAIVRVKKEREAKL